MDFHDSDRRARGCQVCNGYEKWGNLHGARPANGFYHATGKAQLMKPQHISELIAELQASGKLPSDKPARKAKTPRVKPDWDYGIYIGNGTTAKPGRKARQMKLKL
jgi:hypothetical protein